MVHSRIRMALNVAVLLAAPAAFAQHGSTAMPPPVGGHDHAAHAAAPSSEGIADGKLVNGVRTFELAVTEEGFVPARLKANKGETVRLVVTRKTDGTCAKELVVKERAISTPLPLGKAVTVEFKAGQTGEIQFACGMDHVKGVVFIN